MKHPRSACGASPSRGRYQRPGKAGSAVSLALGRAGVVRPGPWLWIASALLLAGCAAPAPTPQRAVDLQAHRGGRALAPENTLSAFTHAIAIGVTTLELDIGLTADDVVVISHDTVLNPDHTRDARGNFLPAKGPAIRSLSLAQLQTYDVGRIDPASSYGKPFPKQLWHDGERIPTLAALFAQANQLGAADVRFNIETKLDPGRPEETASPEQMVRALLAEIDKAGMARRVTVQSFDWRSLALVGQWAPQMPRAYLTSTRTLQDSRWTAGLRLAEFGSAPRLVKAAAGDGGGPVTWSPAFNDLSPALVKEAHALGLAVLPWTVNQRADMVRLLDWGVDGIITDDPAILRDLLGERGAPLPAKRGR
jgi:glycerophosphoryl diester phosphodiesterase